MKKKVFFLNAAFLTATSLITRTIGISFRVFMSNKIGAEGIGLYSLIGTVYFFAATVSTSGITLVVTRLVTDCIATGKRGAVKTILRKCFFTSLILSCAAGVCLYFFSVPISIGFLHDKRAVLSLKILAPGLPFMAVSACFRGYFFARRTVIKTASEQLIEQLLEIIVFVIIISSFSGGGVELACCAIVIGTTVAEVASSFYSYALYKLDIRKISEKPAPAPGFIKKALSIGIPVTLSSTLRSGLSMIENALIPVGFKKYGVSEKTALSDYGILTGMVMPVLFFPSVFLFSFSQLMIPEMSEAKAHNHTKGISYMATRIFRIALFFSIPTAGVFFALSKQLGQLIYGSSDIGVYIGILAPIVPLVYLDSVVDGMLKGLNEQLHYLSYNIIDSVLRVTLIFFLVPKYGIKGLITVMFISAIVNSGLSMMRLIKVAKVHLNVIDWILKPLICVGAAAALVTRLFNSHTVLQIVIIILLYVLFMLIFRGIKKEEINWIKSFVRKRRKKPDVHTS